MGENRICQEIYLNLADHSLLEKQTKEQTYCEGCQKWVIQYMGYGNLIKA